MNKNAIKSYAIWARKELIDRVKRKAYEYEVTENSTPKVSADSVNGRLLTNIEKTQLNSLIIELYKHSFNHVVEEVAYTWFNRFIALRFMEVNGFLPQKINVFTNDKNEFKPQIMDEAISVELKGLNKQTVIKYIEDNNQDELYKYLLLCLCNDMNDYLPDMFTPIDDYKALLIPDNLLNEGSVIDRLVKDIPVDDWTDQVQIIGWLYQYYNSELKDTVMKKKEYSKDDIPAATQLFTPDWIVRYMVENSLGKLWLDGHPNFKHEQWKYYLEDTKQEPEVEKQLNLIKQEHSKIKPEEIKILEPCMGSGHILVYAFDVLLDIYRDCGYSDRDAARSILENNLYGIEIDERAYQLAYFSIMMKARTYNRRILTDKVNHNLIEINESNGFKKELLHYLGEYEETASTIVDLFKDAKDFGSLINVDIPIETINKLEEKLLEVERSSISKDLITETESIELVQAFSPVLKEAKVLAQKYDVVVTNPPYMSPSPKQKPFVQEHYPDSKSDLFAVFIERCHELNEVNGYQAMITMHSWMFLSSYENLRNKLLKLDLLNMIHLGARAFDEIGGEVVQTTSFLFMNSSIQNVIVTYCRLIEPTSESGKENAYLLKANRYKTTQDNFKKIPGSPIAYWASDNVLKCFSYGLLNKCATFAKGMDTGNNDTFIRVWFEVNRKKFSESDSVKWRPYNKGGEYRKWYGNLSYVIDWENNGKRVKSYPKSNIRNESKYFFPGYTWTLLNIENFGLRYIPNGTIFDGNGCMMFVNNDYLNNYVFGFMNSKVFLYIAKMISSTMAWVIGNLKTIPFIFLENNRVEYSVVKNYEYSKLDWDSYETSWDFSVNPIIKQLDYLWDATAIGATIHKYYGRHIEVNSNMELCYHLWKIECNERFKRLKENEEELNRIFIDIYGLQDELTPEESNKDVTVHYVVDSKDDIPSSFEGSNYVRTKQDEIKSFISYAVGCMFGRYSLDKEGLAYAGGEWNDDKYKSFIPDKDNIIPIYEDEYYGDDDITGRFIEFVKVVFGTEELEANLKFIADTLGGRGTPREVIRSYFINDFFKDHCNTYQVTGSGKRPIYWQFDSGKKNGFKALIYIHRYKPDLIARMRTEYIHPQQARFRTQISLLEAQLQNADKANQIKINKQIQSIKEKANELAIYEEKIHHWADKMEPMDLDDGVVYNYNKFQELLVPNIVKKPKE